MSLLSLSFFGCLAAKKWNYIAKKLRDRKREKKSERKRERKKRMIERETERKGEEQKKNMAWLLERITQVKLHTIGEKF